jgi:hypothetical protein
MYTMDQYKQDKIALDAARQDISSLVAGEGAGRTKRYQGEYGRMVSYWEPVKATMRDYARMFMAISERPAITGFDVLIYSQMLDVMEKKIKSMRTFKRRGKIKCFAPKEHKQPCYCARLEAVQAAISIAQANVDDNLKEELVAKVSGALALEVRHEE